MKTISIHYNPYLVTTEIKVDGQVPADGGNDPKTEPGVQAARRRIRRDMRLYRPGDRGAEAHGPEMDRDPRKQLGGPKRDHKPAGNQISG